MEPRNVPAPPDPGAPSTPPVRPGSWSVMEARLTTARVEDLLTDAEHRLQRLATTEDLTPEVAAAVEGTLADLRQGRARIGSARRCLRTTPTETSTTSTPPLHIVPPLRDLV